MRAIKPQVTVDGDVDGVLASNGWVVGWNLFRVVWRFGFDPGSPQAKAFGASTASPTWVMTTHGGDVTEKFVGKEADLPQHFLSVLGRKHDGK